MRSAPPTYIVGLGAQRSQRTRLVWRTLPRNLHWVVHHQSASFLLHDFWLHLETHIWHTLNPT